MKKRSLERPRYTFITIVEFSEFYSVRFISNPDERHKAVVEMIL